MALNAEWVQDLLWYRRTLRALVPSVHPFQSSSDSGEVGRASIDGALIVYDPQDPPSWLVPVLAARDDDGNTCGAGWPD